MPSGRQETSLGRRAGSWPRAPLSPPQDHAFLRPALGRARRSRGRKRKEVLCISFFSTLSTEAKKKSHLKRPRDPLRSLLPTSGLSRAAAAAFTRARSSQHPSPHFRVPAAAAAAASRPGKPPSLLRVAGEGAAPARVLGARPRRRARAALLSVAGRGSRRCSRAVARRPPAPGDPREGVLLSDPECPAWSGWGFRPRSPVGSGSCAISPCQRVWERKSPETPGEL